MFLVGIGPADNDDATVAFIFKKRLKNVRHHYHLIDIINIPFPIGADEIKAHIIRLHGGKNYITLKKIFSQDGRPPKMIRVHPRLIVNCTTAGQDVINGLREDGIPVEGFFIQTIHGWKKETLGKALGDNYRVCISDLMNTLLDVYQQKRLDFADHLKKQNVLLKRLDGLCKSKLDGKEIIDMVAFNEAAVTLSLPVWFREKIRYKRPYRA